MRMSRRFSPSLEPMSARIAPSTFAPAIHGGAVSPHSGIVGALDDAPTSPPTDTGSSPIVDDPPSGTTTNTVC
jgi:hypothetical protein